MEWLTDVEIKEMDRRDLHVELKRLEKEFKRACAELHRARPVAYDAMVSAGRCIEKIKGELSSKRDSDSWVN